MKYQRTYWLWLQVMRGQAAFGPVAGSVFSLTLALCRSLAFYVLQFLSDPLSVFFNLNCNQRLTLLFDLILLLSFRWHY